MRRALEAEQAALGRLIVSPEMLDDVDLIAADFVDGRHSEIFAALASMHADGKAIDLMLLRDVLGYAGESLSYLGGLARGGCVASNLAAYVEVIREESAKRNLRKVLLDALADIDQNLTDSSADLVDRSQSRLMLLNPDKSGRVMSFNDLLKNFVDSLEAEDAIGVSTGFADLDRMIRGLRGGKLYIFAGRPSMGKSTLAMNIATAVAQQKMVFFVSLEMPAEEITTNIVASISKVDLDHINDRRLEEKDWSLITAGLAKSKELKLTIDDNPNCSVNKIRAEARRISRRSELGLVVVDYLQLMESSGESRENDVSKISRGLKLLAKELNVPVLALSQLNRGCEARTNKRPLMIDLRESGAIEQDADVVVMIYRDEVYNEDSPDRGTCELIIRKQRGGKIGVVRVASNLGIARFDDLINYVPHASEEPKKPKYSGFRGDYYEN